MKITTHYDNNADEWPLVLHDDNGGEYGIGGMNGKEEADTVCAILNGALMLHHNVVDDLQKISDIEIGGPSFEQMRYLEGKQFADGLVKGRLLLEYTMLSGSR